MGLGADQADPLWDAYQVRGSSCHGADVASWQLAAGGWRWSWHLLTMMRSCLPDPLLSAPLHMQAAREEEEAMAQSDDGAGREGKENKVLAMAVVERG